MDNGTIRVSSVVDLAGIQAGMPQAAAVVEANTAKMVSSFQAVAAESAASTAKVNASMGGMARGQMMEAQHAVRGLGELVGVHMPRMVSRFVADIGGVGPIMAAAFAPIAVMLLVDTLGKIPEALEHGIDKLRGWDKEAKEKFTDELNLSYKLKEAYDRQYEAWVKTGAVGMTGTGKLAEEQQENQTLIALTNKQIVEEQQRLDGLNATYKVNAAPGFWKSLADAALLAAGNTQAAFDLAKLGLGKEREELEETIKKQKAYVASLQVKPVELGTDSLRLNAEMQAELHHQAIETATARVEGEKSTGLALLAARDAYVRDLYAERRVSLDTETAVLKQAADQKLDLEIKGAEARVTQVRQEGGNVAAAEVKSNAAIATARIEHQRTLDKIDADALKESDRLMDQRVKHHIEGLNYEMHYEFEVHQHVIDLNEKLHQEIIAAAEAEASAKIASAGRAYEFGKQRIEEEFQLHRIGVQQKIADLKALETQQFATQMAAAQDRLKDEQAKGNKGEGTDQNLAGIANAQAKIDEMRDQYKLIMAELDAEAKKSALNMQKVSVTSIMSITSAFNQGFDQWIAGHKKFTVAMAQSFRQMADQATESLVRISMQVLKNVAIEEVTGKKEQLIAAKAGAAKAYKSAMDLPAPMNVIVGAGEAAVVFASIMAFDTGGIAPKTGMSLVHEGERVLTQSQTNTFERILETGGAGDTHQHYHASAGESPDSVMRNAAAFQRAMRDGRVFA